MQHDNVYSKIHSLLSWKRIATFNVILFLVTVVPISVRLAQQDTENRSSAAEVVVPVVVPPPNYPGTAPVIERVTEWFGKKGDTVIILGKNFGAYQWESKLYLGNVEAENNNIVRWSDSVIEVQIPESARTGKVWINVNDRQASWDGSLLLTEVARAAQIKLVKTSQTQARVSLSNSAGAVRGILEFGHVSEPLRFAMRNGTITNSIQTLDSLGKKTKVKFDFEQPLGSSSTELMTMEYPGIGSVEILRVEIYDAADKLIPVYAEPLSVKIN